MSGASVNRHASATRSAQHRAIVVHAGRRHGVLGDVELAALGLGREAIARRIRSGWLTKLFPRAYAVGHHNLTRRSYWRAAVLSCGAGSFLSHRAAAQLAGMADLIPGPPHVTIPNNRTLERDGIVIHRSRRLPSLQTTLLHGIPVTTPARTLLDFASQASHSELRDAVRAAKRIELVEAHDVAALCRDSRGRKGVGRLRELLEIDHGPLALTRSPLEDLFLPICAEFGIRYPETNATVLGCGVDCLWLPERLVVELDGWEWHKNRESFEEDRRRDAKLGVAGYHVQRLTDERLHRERAGVAGEVIALLDRLGGGRAASG